MQMAAANSDTDGRCSEAIEELESAMDTSSGSHLRVKLLPKAGACSRGGISAREREAARAPHALSFRGHRSQARGRW